MRVEVKVEVDCLKFTVFNVSHLYLMPKFFMHEYVIFPVGRDSLGGTFDRLDERENAAEIFEVLTTEWGGVLHSRFRLGGTVQRRSWGKSEF